MDFLGGIVKFKPIFIYPALVIIIAVVLLLVTVNSDKTMEKNNGSITDKEMPNDEIHQDLDIPGKESPGKGNVTSSVFERLEELKKEVEKNPKDTLKLREYADFLAAAHKPDEAILYYEKILKIDPKKKDVLFNLSFIYYNNIKNFDKAESLTNTILKYYPEDTQAMYNLGAIKASKGDRETARQIWEKIIKDFPNSASAELAKTSLTQL